MPKQLFLSIFNDMMAPLLCVNFACCPTSDKDGSKFNLQCVVFGGVETKLRVANQTLSVKERNFVLRKETTFQLVSGKKTDRANSVNIGAALFGCSAHPEEIFLFSE